jgi:hypothetical protein
MPATPLKPAIRICLEIRGLGHVPALKNSMYSIVNKENRDWKRRCVQLIVSQLLSAMQTGGCATPMPPSLPSLIASLPPDDNWKVLRGGVHLLPIKVRPGEEGADILIEPLPPAS